MTAPDHPPAPAAPAFAERLRVPVHWWLTPIFFVIVLGVGFEVYLGLFASVAFTVVFVAGLIAGLLRYGALDVVVDGTGLLAGAHHLPATALGDAHPLDAAQAQALRGPRADTRARIVLRGYVATAVRVDVIDTASRAPYWYVSTRRPHELAAVLTAARAGIWPH